MASVYPKLTELIEKPFFRYFKINLYTQCPLWPDDGQCMLETCAVEECDDGEVRRVSAWPLAAAEGSAPSPLPSRMFRALSLGAAC